MRSHPSRPPILRSHPSTSSCTLIDYSDFHPVFILNELEGLTTLVSQLVLKAAARQRVSSCRSRTQRCISHSVHVETVL